MLELRSSYSPDVQKRSRFTDGFLEDKGVWRGFIYTFEAVLLYSFNNQGG